MLLPPVRLYCSDREMTPLSHAALPIIIAVAVDCRHIARTGAPLVNRWHILAIGISGMLPDVLDPHILLSDRLNSWTHTGWFMGLVTVICLGAARRVPAHHRPAFLLCCMAICLHIVSDLLSGGVALLPPFVGVVGDYYIPVRYWLHIDLVTIVGAYLLCWRSRHLLRAVGRKI